MKKRNALYGALMGSMIVVSGCGGGDVETGEEENQTGTEGEDTTIQFWHIETGAKEEVYLNAIERYENDNPGVTVEPLRIPNDDYKQRMVVAMSGGNPPDVFHSWGGGWLGEFVDSGQVLNLSEEDVSTDRFLDLAMDNSTYEDEVYGLPLGLSLTMNFYNTKIFDELGLEEPETYEELKEVIEVLKESEYDPYALTNQTQWPGSYFYMYFADRLGGSDLFADALEGEGNFADEDFVEAGEKIQELVEMGGFNEGFNGIPYDAGQGRQLMYSEQAAMMLMTTTFVNNVRDEYPEFEENLDAFTFPEVEGGEGNPTNLNGSVSPVLSVYENTEHKEESIELIEYLTSEETAQDFVEKTSSLSGLEGIVSDDPYVQQFSELVEEAEFIQMPYDQTLPPALAETHLNSVQEVFGLSITPEEAAERMEAEAESSRE